MPVTVFAAVFGEDVDATPQEFPNDGNDGCGVASMGPNQPIRTVNVFDVTQGSPFSGQAVPQGATLLLAELLMTTDGAGTGNGADSYDVKRYGTLGQDPQADNASTALARCASGTTYVNTTLYRTNNTQHTVDLGATGLADLTDRVRNAASVWAISIKQVSETLGVVHWASFHEYTDATPANRPQLRVTWAVGDADPGASRQRMLRQILAH